jgi:hypothetical protein
MFNSRINKLERFGVRCDKLGRPARWKGVCHICKKAEAHVSTCARRGDIGGRALVDKVLIKVGA